jgi:hypothetical protein
MSCSGCVQYMRIHTRDVKGHSTRCYGPHCCTLYSAGRIHKPVLLKRLKTNIRTIFLQVSQLPLHMFRLQQAIFRGSKFYICTTSISSIISTSYINIKQTLNSKWIRISPLSAVKIYKIQGMSFTSLSCYMYKRLKVSLKLHIYWL